MSKFIRLTDPCGTVSFYHVDSILEFSPGSEGGSFIQMENTYFNVIETPDQILALIEGDESGLKERVAFLDAALDQAIREGGFYIDGLTIRDGDDLRFAQVADVPELAEAIRRRDQP